MRLPIALLAAAVTLAGCGARQDRTASLEPASPSHIRIYGRYLPRCQYRELGVVSGRMISDVRSAAFAMRANAVLMEPGDNGPAAGGTPLTGTAIQFLSADCRR
jgi:hypothetical protein